MRCDRVEGQTPSSANRPPQRRKRRLSFGKSADALPELSQSNRHFQRQKCQPKALSIAITNTIPGRLMVRRMPLEHVIGVRVSTREPAALSSRGLGRRPLTAVTRVRIPLGLPHKPRNHAVLLRDFANRPTSGPRSRGNYGRSTGIIAVTTITSLSLARRSRRSSAQRPASAMSRVVSMGHSARFAEGLIRLPNWLPPTRVGQPR